MASTILNANLPSSTITINAGGATGSASPYYYSTAATGTMPSGAFLTAGSNGTSWGTITTNPIHPALQVTGDADIKGALKVQGRDIGKHLEAIEKRLAILVPDPKKLEKFEALQKAYNHYKLLEALCQEEDNDKKS